MHLLGCARRARLLAWALVPLAAGCSSDAAGVEPLADRRAPPPWQPPEEAAALEVAIERDGTIYVQGVRHEPEELQRALEGEASGRSRTHRAVVVQIDPAATWRSARLLMASCRRLGLHNLHWGIDPERPAVPWPLLPQRSGQRIAEVRLLGSGSYALRLDGAAGEPASLADVVARLRHARARGVLVVAALGTRFEEVYEAAEAFRALGLSVAFATA